MKVRLKLFAALREIAGREEIVLDLSDGTTVGALWDRLLTEHPRLSPYTDIVQVAVNHDVVGPETSLSADDEVAFLPPVSGG